MTSRIDSCPPPAHLGSGCCGEVSSVEGSPDRVIKRYAALSIDRAVLSRTFRRMEAMPPHPGIEKLLDHQLGASPGRALFEKASGRRLEAAGPMKEPTAWKIIRQLAETLGHAHKHGLFHGHLYPGTIRIDETRDDPQPIVLDFGTGLVGEIHHIDLGDSLFYAAPEQLECGGREWEEGAAQRWDVYSFGQIAYHLIHGDLPRGMHYLKRRSKEVAHSHGRPVELDLDAFLEELHGKPKIGWGISLTVSHEHRLYREIVERCLSLDPAERPIDMREVRNQFRLLDHQFALEHAEERVMRERLKQKTKLIGARALAACLGVSFFLASYYLVDYLRKTSFFQNKVSELDQVVLTQKATIHHLDERWAETVTDLKSSRQAADAFFQRMAQGDAAGGSGVSTLKPEELETSREYYLQTLADVGTGAETALERARALHSLAHIERKMGLEEKAADHFLDAADEFENLVDRGQSPEKQRIDVHLRLADCYENLGSLAENPIGAEALAAMEKAVAQFESALALDPANEETVSRQAGTSFLLGRAYDAHEAHDRALAAYSRSAELATELRDRSEAPSDSLTELIGKLQFSAASSLRKLDRVEEAIDAHIAAMETLEQLRSVNGFTPLQSIQLASSYLQLGQLFATKEATSEDLDQLFNESLRLLTPLNTADPSDVEVAILLCESLVRLGELERLDERWSDGYKLSVRGIEALKEALDLSGTPHLRGLCALAEMRLEHLAFLESEEKAARNVLEKGVETTREIQEVLAGELVEDADFLEEPLRSQYHRRLVGIFGAYADACDKLGESELAQLCRKQAALQLVHVDSAEGITIE